MWLILQTVEKTMLYHVQGDREYVIYWNTICLPYLHSRTLTYFSVFIT